MDAKAEIHELQQSQTVTAATCFESAFREDALISPALASKNIFPHRGPETGVLSTLFFWNDYEESGLSTLVLSFSPSACSLQVPY